MAKKCPYCHKNNVKAFDSRQKDGYFKRRYKCLDCGRRYNTYELSELDYEYVTNQLKYLNKDEIDLEDVIAFEKKKIANSDDAERKERASYQRKVINILTKCRDKINIPKQDAIVKKFGNAQYNICMEECAELVQAINKHIRYNTKSTKEHLIEEIADVLICIEQLKILTDIDDKDIQDFVLKKWRRTKKRLLDKR